MASKSPGSLTWLGKYLSLAMVLPASVAAGYLLGAFANRYLNWPLFARHRHRTRHDGRAGARLPGTHP